MEIEHAHAPGRLPGPTDPKSMAARRKDVRTAQYFAAHGVFYHHNFMPAFIEDLRTVSVLALIQSPFATSAGVQQALPLIKGLIARNVPVCTFIQEPHKWERRHTGTLEFGEQKRMNQLEECLDDLRNAGAHVNLRERIHEKVHCLDNRILWDGSLNALSHYNTTERMNRWFSAARTHDAMLAHRLHHCLECNDFSIAAALTRNEEAQLKFIGRQIAQRREALRLSQSEVAAHANTVQPVISQIESGSLDMRSGTLTQIAQAIGLRLLCVPTFFLPSIGLQLKKAQSGTGPLKPAITHQPTTPIDESVIVPAMLARQRQRLRISQRQLAQKAGVHHNTVSTFELGNTSMHLSMLMRVCRLAGLEIVCVPEAVAVQVIRQLKIEMTSPLFGRPQDKKTCYDQPF
jgi:transcriptional regulator with XRE-family HTH domain